MQRMNINTLDYWNRKFNKDWDENGGKTQTMFFSSLILMALPREISDEIRKQQYNIGDVSCGEGDGIPIIHSEFPANRIMGYDFSETAIARAKTDYPDFPFETANLFEKKYPEDVLICSNTMEHFDEPWNILGRLTESHPQYIIVAVPWEEPEESMQAEHVYRFAEHNILNEYCGYKLIHFEIFDTAELDHTPWPGMQLIMIYAPKEHEWPVVHVEVNDKVHKQIEKSMKVLNDLSLVFNIVFRQSALLRCSNNRWMESEQKCGEQQQKQQQAIVDIANYYEKKLSDCTAELQAWKTQYETAAAQLHRKNVALLHRMADKVYGFAAKHPFVTRIAKRLKKLVKKTPESASNVISSVVTLEEMLKNYTGEYVLIFGENNFDLAREASGLGYCSIRIGEDDVYKAKRPFSITAKKEVLFDIMDTIQRSTKKAIIFAGEENWYKDYYEKAFRYVVAKDEEKDLPFATLIERRGTPLDTLANTLLRIEKTIVPENDVVVLSVIDWDYRFQRPQHIAAGLAKLGNRVFYVNSTFNRDATEYKKGVGCISMRAYVPNIYQVNSETDIYDVSRALENVIKRNNIRNATFVVEYPLWQPIIERLAKKYKFKVIFDYLDDFGGFTETNDNELLLPSFEKIRKESDVIFASSEYLYEKALIANENVCMVRNGTEFAHFNQIDKKKKHERPIIGYYGAIADWFADELVYEAAKELSEYDFVLIGDCTQGNVEKLQKLPNVKFLGEKNYADLPQYLAEFDVALIPFNASLELIKATNPVKFYEYLSAGKKVVATKIPELSEYEGRFVLLANDIEGFISSIERCVEGTDGLANEEERIEFARWNDWLCRIEDIQKHLPERSREAEKASIVIITYNNLRLNQECLNSIFSKTRYNNYEVIVVDNASSDGTPEYLEAISKIHSNMKVVLNQENRGFAGGNNDGIRVSEGDYIILLNNDTVVTPYWLNDLIAHLKDDSIGMVGPVTNCIANEAQIETAYKDYSGLDEFAAYYTQSHKGEIFDIPILAMFCVAMTRKTFRIVGEIDEEFGMGMFEDDDYAMRIHDQGLRTICAEDAFVHHVGKQSFSKLDTESYNMLFEKNKAIYEKKYGKWVPHRQRNRSGI